MRAVSIVAALMATVSPAALADSLSVMPSSGIISAPGSYYLSGPRTSTGAYNIQIGAANVDLDLRGQTVRCAPPNPALAVTYGVLISNDHVTVRNGTIVGCWAGVIGGGYYTVLRGLDLTGSTYMGASITGFGSQISDSVFQGIGGYHGEAYAIGINGMGSGCLVERNTFRNIHRQAGVAPSLAGEGVGVLISANVTGCVIRSNWMEGLDIGVWLATGSGADVLENTIGDVLDAALRGAPAAATVTNNRLWERTPASGSIGIGGASITASRNLISGFDQPIMGGAVDVGDNTIIP